MGLGTKIRERREKLGLSLSDLAAKVGVTPACIHYWETDSRVPQMNNWRRLAQVLGVPMSFFLTDGPSAPETIIHD